MRQEREGGREGGREGRQFGKTRLTMYMCINCAYPIELTQVPLTLFTPTNTDGTGACFLATCPSGNL